MPENTPIQSTPLGVLSLLLALLSFAGCIITGLLVQFVHFSSVVGFLFLPILSLTALIMALWVLIGPGRGHAAEKPFTRGPALLGFLVALLALVGQVTISGVGLSVYIPMKQRVLPAADEMVRNINAGRPERALEAFASTYRARIAPDDLSAIFGIVTSELGPIEDVVFRISTAQRARDTLGQLAGTVDPGDENLPKPVELHCRDGIAMLWLLLDEVALQREEIRFMDLLVVLPDLRALTLFPDGRMAMYARSFGLTIIDWRAGRPLSGPQPGEERNADGGEEHRGDEGAEPGR